MSSFQVAIPELRPGFGRDVVQAELLIPPAAFPHEGSWSAFKLAKAQYLVPHDRATASRWTADGSGVVEYVVKHESVLSARDFFDAHDPRRDFVNDHGSSMYTGDWVPHKGAGNPDASKYLCGETARSEDRGFSLCTQWVWWARYGQYTVYLDVGGLVPIEERDVTNLIDAMSSHIDLRLAR